MNKLISASLVIALTSVSIGWAGNLESEAMEETVMVAEETMATDFLGSNTGLWVVGAFILALLASEENSSGTNTTN
jgi:disulfide bond formation protein DsbB